MTRRKTDPSAVGVRREAAKTLRRPPASGPIAQQSTPDHPLPPGWFDVLKHWVERLPGPYWLAYVVLGGVFFATETVLHIPGSESAGGLINPVRTLLSVMAVGFLLLMHALDRLAAFSFDAFRPVLRASDLEARHLRHQLISMPPRPALGAALLGVLSGLTVMLAPSLARVASGSEVRVALAEVMRVIGVFEISTAPASLAFNGVVLALTWWATGTLVYHTIRQLRWVSRIYTDFTDVDLLKPGPLYRLSRITASTALGLIAVVYLWFAASPKFFANPINLASAAFLGSLALGAFLLPLLGIHRTIVNEKEQMVHESSDRLKASLGELHRRVDHNRFEQMDDLSKAISSLEIERNLLNRVPTWPWQPEAPRTVIGALLLPLMLWVAQAVLGRVLGP